MQYMTKHEDPANANAQPQRPPSNCTREQPATPTINPPPHRRLAKTTSTDLRHLLHHRNDIKLTHDGLSLALIDASRADHERDAKILLEAGADVNYTGPFRSVSTGAAQSLGGCEALDEKGALDDRREALEKRHAMRMIHEHYYGEVVVERAVRAR
ncbi:hypothetical protein WAI453_002603 [Rhynchosporium graminicola]